MNEWLGFAGALIAGMAAGGLFFGGLWLTVKKGVRMKNPALLFTGSFLLRTATTLTIFYYVSSGNWQRLLACTAGFLAARYLVTYFTGSAKPSGSSPDRP